MPTSGSSRVLLLGSQPGVPRPSTNYRLLGHRLLAQHLGIGAELVEILAALVAALRQLRQRSPLLRRELELDVAAAGEAGLERVVARALVGHLLAALLHGRAVHEIRIGAVAVGATGH